MPVISVIVPIYNAERYLSRCIDSVLSQTLTDFELLLIDDGSTDNSRIICDRYIQKDTRIRVFHKENGGVSSARNLGLDMAKGEYVIFLDADDFYCDKNCLKRLYLAAQDSQLDVVRGEYKTVNREGSDLCFYSLTENRKAWKAKILSPDIFLKEVLQGEFFMVLMLIRRNKIAHLRFQQGQVFLEDMHFLMLLFQQPLRCKYLPFVFYAYRKTEESVSGSCSVGNIKDSFAMCDVFARLAENPSTIIMRDYCRNYSIMMFYWTMNTVAEYFDKKQRSIIIKDLNLPSLQVVTRKRILSWKIFNKSLVTVLLPLSLVIPLLRLRIKIAHCKKQLLNG